MSHDEQQSRDGFDPGPGPDRLARWLEQPPDAPPPEDLEDEVVEAVIALRPERAPALRLSADDILASVTRGPLADPSAAAGASGGPEPSTPAEVLPFPSRPRPEAPAPVVSGGPRRWLAWAGGTSSIGLALVAAAALLLVVGPGGAPTPGALEEARQEPSPASSTSAPTSSASGPAEAPAAEEQAQRVATADDAPPPPPPPPAAAARPAEQALAEAPARARVAPSAPLAQAPIEMGDGAVLKSNTLIPELEDAVADADEEPFAPEGQAAPAQGYEREEAAPAKELESDAGARSRAVPRDLQASGWRKGVDRPTLDTIDAALSEAQALRSTGDRRGAADRLARAVGAPARAGQHVAALAAADYLASGAAGAAVSIAAAGIGLSSANTPERSQLLVVYGDALLATGDPAGAHDAWRQAEEANAAR